MPRSEAQKKADKKYKEKTYRKYTVNTRVELVENIDKYKEKYGFNSDAGIFNAAVRYIIEHDIPLKPTHIVWTQEALEFFIKEAELSEFEVNVLKTRIDGMTISNQAEYLNCTKYKVNSAIKRIKLLYDACQLQRPDILPPRVVSETEKYMDSN